MVTTAPTESLEAAMSLHEYAKPGDWEQYRQIIGELYRDMTLPRLIEHMESQYGFRATPKMFKDRLRKWKLDMKNRRPATRKPRAMWMRKEKQACAYNASSSSVPGQVTLTSRPPNFQNEALHFLSSGLTKSLSTLQYDRHYDVLIHVENYFKGSFQRGTWILTSGTWLRLSKWTAQGSRELTSLREHSFAAISELRNGQQSEAEKLLVLALAPMSRIAREEAPRLMSHLIEIAAEFWLKGLHGVGYQVFQHISGILNVVCASGHPLTKLASWLLSVFNLTFTPEHLLSVFQCLCDNIEAIAGSWSQIAFELRRIFDMLQIRLITTYPAGLERISRSLRDVMRSFGVLDFKYLKLLELYSGALYELGDHMGSAKAAKRGLFCTAALPPNNALSWRSVFLARLAWASRRADGAAKYMEESITLRRREFGNNDSRTMYQMSQLECWFLKWGDLASATRLRIERYSLLRPIIDNSMV